MTEIENKKFKYKKDRMDWILVSIILFTVLCFALLVYGTQFFNDYNEVRETGPDGNQISELVENRAKLERQISEYQENTEIQN